MTTSIFTTEALTPESFEEAIQKARHTVEKLRDPFISLEIVFGDFITRFEYGSFNAEDFIIESSIMMDEDEWHESFYPIKSWDEFLSEINDENFKPEAFCVK